jgi:hypothetical protein
MVLNRSVSKIYHSEQKDQCKRPIFDPVSFDLVLKIFYAPVKLIDGISEQIEKHLFYAVASCKNTSYFSDLILFVGDPHIQANSNASVEKDPENHRIKDMKKPENHDNGIQEKNAAHGAEHKPERK